MNSVADSGQMEEIVTFQDHAGPPRRLGLPESSFGLASCVLGGTGRRRKNGNTKSESF